LPGGEGKEGVSFLTIKKEVIPLKKAPELQACPILSLLKAALVYCRTKACAWWVEESQLCAVAAVAGFFQERRFAPPK
jgi:hypothetical protein